MGVGSIELWPDRRARAIWRDFRTDEPNLASLQLLRLSGVTPRPMVELTRPAIAVWIRVDRHAVSKTGGVPTPTGASPVRWGSLEPTLIFLPCLLLS
jgi:hypothetical protein